MEGSGLPGAKADHHRHALLRQAMGPDEGAVRRVVPRCIEPGKGRSGTRRSQPEGVGLSVRLPVFLPLHDDLEL